MSLHEIRELDSAEIDQISGAGAGIDYDPTLKLSELMTQFELTGGLTRPATVHDAIAYGKANNMAVYIDGVQVTWP